MLPIINELSLNPSIALDKIARGAAYAAVTIPLTALMQCALYNLLSCSINGEKITSARISIGVPQSLEFTTEDVVWPIVEECLFRGLLQDFILKKVLPRRINRPQIRNLITANLFAFCHYKSNVLPVLCIGLVWGEIRQSNLGLWGSIGAHVAHNLVSYAGIMNIKVEVESPFQALDNRIQGILQNHPLTNCDTLQ